MWSRRVVLLVAFLAALTSCAAPRYYFPPGWPPFYSSSGCFFWGDPLEAEVEANLRKSAPELFLWRDRQCELIAAMIRMHLVEVRTMICQRNGNDVDIFANLRTPMGIALDVTRVDLKNVNLVGQKLLGDLTGQPFQPPFHVEPVTQQTPVIASVTPSSFPVQIVMDVYVMQDTAIVGIRGGRSCMVA